VGCALGACPSHQAGDIIWHPYHDLSMAAGLAAECVCSPSQQEFLVQEVLHRYHSSHPHCACGLTCPLFSITILFLVLLICVQIHDDMPYTRSEVQEMPARHKGRLCSSSKNSSYSKLPQAAVGLGMHVNQYFCLSFNLSSASGLRFAKPSVDLNMSTWSIVVDRDRGVGWGGCAMQSTSYTLMRGIVINLPSCDNPSCNHD